jgi:hypothetical protein
MNQRPVLSRASCAKSRRDEGSLPERNASILRRLSGFTVVSSLTARVIVTYRTGPSCCTDAASFNAYFELVKSPTASFDSDNTLLKPYAVLTGGFLSRLNGTCGQCPRRHPGCTIGQQSSSRLPTDSLSTVRTKLCETLVIRCSVSRLYPPVPQALILFSLLQADGRRELFVSPAYSRRRGHGDEEQQH